MKIAIISDIHANLTALRAVLADLSPVDAMICAGDMVGYYSEPDEVCSLLRRLDVLSIRGNHDAYVTGRLAPRNDLRAAYRTDWTAGALKRANLDWLDGLPVERKVAIGGRRITVRHASPWDEETRLYPDSPRIEEIRLAAEEVLIVGHTHRPLVRQCGDGWLVNPGSIGQPRDGDPRASYAVLDPGDGLAEIRRVAYDVAGCQERLRQAGWDEAMAALLAHGGASR
jgi:putative phosphoesterase